MEEDIYKGYELVVIILLEARKAQIIEEIKNIDKKISILKNNIEL